MNVPTLLSAIFALGILSVSANPYLPTPCHKERSLARPGTLNPYLPESSRGLQVAAQLRRSNPYLPEHGHGWSPALITGNPFDGIQKTDRNRLNDLLDDLPFQPFSRQERVQRLSSVQEQLVVFEERMRGKTLPEPLRSGFSIYYSAVLSALVEGRIDEETGRDFLSIHRQLLDRSELWFANPNRDETFDDEVIRNLHYFLTELEETAIPAALIPADVRTPVVNGHQAWVGELLAWGCHRGRLNPGQVSRIEFALRELERFECHYKRDGYLRRHEREELHRRLFELTRRTIEEVGSPR